MLSMTFLIYIYIHTESRQTICLGKWVGSLLFPVEGIKSNKMEAIIQECSITQPV